MWIQLLVLNFIRGAGSTERIPAKSGVNRMWLIEYYEREAAKREKKRVELANAQKIPAAEKRKATIAAKKEAKKQVETLVDQAERDLEVLTQGISNIEVAQRYTMQLIEHAKLKFSPGTDFLSIAADYKKKADQENDDLLLLSMVI